MLYSAKQGRDGLCRSLGLVRGGLAELDDFFKLIDRRVCGRVDLDQRNGEIKCLLFSQPKVGVFDVARLFNKIEIETSVGVFLL